MASSDTPTTAVQGRRKSLLIRFLQPRPPLIEPQNQEPISVDNSNSPLLKLPAELRSLVWEYAFTLSTEERLRIAQDFPKRRDAFGLVLTCKQIKQEIGQLPYLSAVFVIWLGSQWPQEQQKGWVDLPLGYVLRWTNSLPTALRARPETIKCLAVGFSLFTQNDTIPLDSLIDSDILRNANIKPQQFILKICICGNARRPDVVDPHRTMGFCIVLERLAVHFPTLERIVVYYCTRGAYANNDQGVTAIHAYNFPNRVTSSHIVRSSSGAPWGIRTVKGFNGARVEMKWEAAPHPGQALEAVPWTSRTVNIDYYDSVAVSGCACLRDRPKSEGTKGEVKVEELVHTEPSQNTTKTRRRWSSVLKGKIWTK